jgi:hypothetical protein
MSKTRWIALLVVGTCAGFAAGVSVVKVQETRNGPSRATAATTATRFRELRLALADKEDQIEALEREVMEVLAKAVPLMSPEQRQQVAERDRRRKWGVRLRLTNEKSRNLRRKVLQREDRALRTNTLSELEALLGSPNPDDVLLALKVLPSLHFLKYDKAGFRPGIFAALKHADDDIRRDAFACLPEVCEKKDRVDIDLLMVDDPCPELRRDVLFRLRWEASNDQFQGALRHLVRDPDIYVKMLALEMLSQNPDCTDEMEKLAVELSRNPAYAESTFVWLRQRDIINEEMARRLVEMYYEGYGGGQDAFEWLQAQLTESAKPIVMEFCLRLLKDGVEDWEREPALWGLEKIGDAEVLRELQRISRSPDAELIEDKLARAIERLRKRLDQEDGKKR